MLKKLTQPLDIQKVMQQQDYSESIGAVIQDENLLPSGILNRLHRSYPQHSMLDSSGKLLFNTSHNYTGISGFRKVLDTLKENGIVIGSVVERELFVDVYRFLATGYTLNTIDWNHYATDPIFHLVFPQPGMINATVVATYTNANSAAERNQIVLDYMEQTNPHDGNQQLNKPWFKNDDGEIEILAGSQHKYPQVQLVFDQTTQNCFSFCTYCFRHAQVRGDEDMFIQKEVKQVLEYLKRHPEISDLLITGGDAGFIPVSRLEQYVLPIINDPDLLHIKTLRLGSRALTYKPEMILSKGYQKMLALFDKLYANGIQVAWMAHLSTPKELLTPTAIAAIKRLQAHHVVIRSQSPIIMNIGMFRDKIGNIDIQKSAQNWIDLANILSMLHISFHSMYVPRPTGEHKYFSASLADINDIFATIYRSLPSLNRPSRYISMTISAGKLSIIGTTEVQGVKVLALKFTEARNMKWIDKVVLAKHDTASSDVMLLQPLEGKDFFFKEELAEIEQELTAILKQETRQQKQEIEL